MTPYEEFDRAMERLSETAQAFGVAMRDAIVEAGKFLVSQINFQGYSELIKNLLSYKKTYDLAMQENPKWVWYAEHHKKKRVRNKYHNKIMKEYGGKL